MADNQDTSHSGPNQDNEEFVTMVDVLQEEQELEEDANAVLGASDEKNCTYSKVRTSQTYFNKPLINKR